MPLMIDNSAALNQGLLTQTAFEISKCTKCDLCSTRTKTVPGRGSATAKAFFIGEGPGETEDREGLPFVGRAGQYLSRLLFDCGIDEGEIYISNIVKCRPPGNRLPKTEEAKACKHFLWRQLQILRPKIIVCLGNTAASTILSNTPNIGKLLSEKRGRWIPLEWWDIEWPMCRVIHHPSYLMTYAPKIKDGPIDSTKKDLIEIKNRMDIYER